MRRPQRSGVPRHHGKRYYPYDGKRLVAMPGTAHPRHRTTALEWHNEKVFRRAG